MRCEEIPGCSMATVEVEWDGQDGWRVESGHGPITIDGPGVMVRYRGQLWWMAATLWKVEVIGEYLWCTRRAATMDQPRVFSYPLELVSAARFTDDPIPVEITLLHGLIVEAKGLASMLEQDGRGVHHVVRAVADVLERLEPLIAVDEATPQGESS